MTTRFEYYTSTSRAFMAQAETYLAQTDLLQASEKGWGAAAEMVKGIAEAKGWPHQGHAELYRVINRIATETGDREFSVHFHTASSLHINFYEGWLPKEMVEDGLVEVAQLLNKLENLPA